MNKLQALRRVDLRNGRFDRPQKAVLKWVLNRLIRLAIAAGLLLFLAAAIRAWRAGGPAPAAWMLVLLAGVVLSALPVLRVRWVTPVHSAYMRRLTADRRREGDGHPLRHRWVRLDEIHPLMQLAAIAFEDPDFPVHTGFAVRRILVALRENRGREFPRGESTITQQLVKNLFLWPDQTYTRKLVEAYFTVLMECLVPKRRILELYLNFVQLDRDLFGVEEAAGRYFGKTAAGLRAAEAALLVAVLPNPVYYRADGPTPEVLATRAFILQRMEELGLPYLDLLDGRTLDFFRWALHAFRLRIQPVPPWRSFRAAVQLEPGQLDPFLVDAAINQFEVESNPRYRAGQQGWGETYCNIFIWDVTRAMGVEIPHWVDGRGGRTEDGAGAELDANAVIDWLETHGPAQGWRPVDAVRAQALANDGHPVVAAWKNPGGIGHLAVVRPGAYSDQDGPTIAQSGAVNFNRGTVEQGFRQRENGRTVVYFFYSLRTAGA